MVQQFGVGQHPDLPPYLVHFTGRPRGIHSPPLGVPAKPEDRLAMILTCGFIQGFSTFGTWGPVVCTSEVSGAGLAALFSTGVTSRGPYEPWAVVLKRDAAIDLGFRPVWYMDTQERVATNDLPVRMLDRRVTYNPGLEDWLAEREWRLCWGDTEIRPGNVPAISLPGLITAVIVGQSGWQPLRGPAPTWFDGIPRCLWDGQNLVVDGVFAP
ncbi:hypothetical protein [Amycolatopsis sp. MEPSY49]|uniref:hypothetical protein n=1 Tax=Amycolatopsis sp. MEPSY49 TaxID=3151600 RepID=UPI003EFA3F3A